MKTPRFTDAHVGPRARQSAHRRLSSCFIRMDNTRLCSSFCALLTAFLLLLMAADERLPDSVAGGCGRVRWLRCAASASQ